MDFETPVDAWYVWVGVAVASLAIGGVALDLPTQPPPDATAAANTIDAVAGSTQTATARYEHDAVAVRLETGRLSLRNDAGVAHAAVAFESLTPLAAVENDTLRRALERIAHGSQPAEVLSKPTFDGLTETDLRRVTARARATRRTDGAEWRPTTGHLAVRRLTLGGATVVLVDI
jgi:hypothetical protein